MITIHKDLKEQHPHVSYTDIIIKAVSSALQNFPHINSITIENGFKPIKDINIGFAVNVKNGLVVPVIHNSERKTIPEISLERVNLINKSLATSGNYHNYYIDNNVKISHTIDPRTGFPSNSNLVSASVFYNTCVEADAYATAFMVLGLQKSIEIIDKNENLDALLFYTDKNGDLQRYVSNNMSKYFNF